MSIRLRAALMGKLDTLRYEPTQKRIRAELGGHTVLAGTRALLVWGPKRMMPSYASRSRDPAPACLRLLRPHRGGRVDEHPRAPAGSAAPLDFARRTRLSRTT